MKKEQDGFINSFIEKPNKSELGNWKSDTGVEMQNQGKDYLASMGIYILDKEALYKLLLEDCANATDFGKEIIPYSMNKLKVLS